MNKKVSLTYIVVNDDDNRAKQKVARYTDNEDLGNLWNTHGPLELWPKSSNRYSHLAQLASNMCLAIPATSVPTR